MKHCFSHSSLRLSAGLLTLLFGVLFMASSCTDVKLCEEDEHPHHANALYYFYWNHFSNKSPVDSMYVVAYRVINQWKSTMCVSTKTRFGHFLHNPYQLTSDSIDAFRISSGDYKFLTFSYYPDEFDYSTVDSFITTSSIPLQDISIHYKLYERSDSVLSVVIPDWTDYNVYNGQKCYMQPELHTLCYDTLSVRKLWPNGYYQLNFYPRPLTQHIDVSFDIEKNLTNTTGFTVDSVFAELSGIPTTIGLFTGFLDITRTGKTMFKMKFTKDKLMNKKLSLKASIDVPSVIQNTDDKTYYGPGIMQVVIYTTTTYQSPYTNTTETLRKAFQGKINLYNSLKTANLIKYTNDGLHVMRNGDKKTLRINAKMVIDGEKIIKNADDYGGLDRWENADKNPIFVDI